MVSDTLPFEASYSRLVQKLSQTTLLEKIQDKLLLQAIQEGFVDDEAVAIDDNHFESRDRGQAQEKVITSNSITDLLRLHPD